MPEDGRRSNLPSMRILQLGASKKRAFQRLSPEHGMAYMDPNMVQALPGVPVEVPTTQLEKAKELLRASEFESQEA